MSILSKSGFEIDILKGQLTSRPILVLFRKIKTIEVNLVSIPIPN